MPSRRRAGKILVLYPADYELLPVIFLDLHYWFPTLEWLNPNPGLRRKRGEAGVFEFRAEVQGALFRGCHRDYAEVRDAIALGVIAFAIDLLSNGVSLEDVATLLGNTVKIAEKHYAPWVQARQISLEKSIERAWRLG